MVSERRVELHTVVEQGLVRYLEFPPVVLRPIGPVQVVAQHDREGERELHMKLGDLMGDGILLLVAGAGVSDDRKPHRALALGQGDFLRNDRNGPPEGQGRAKDPRQSFHGVWFPTRQPEPRSASHRG